MAGVGLISPRLHLDSNATGASSDVSEVLGCSSSLESLREGEPAPAAAQAIKAEKNENVSIL